MCRVLPVQVLLLEWKPEIHSPTLPRTQGTDTWLALYQADTPLQSLAQKRAMRGSGHWHRHRCPAQVGSSGKGSGVQSVCGTCGLRYPSLVAVALWSITWFFLILFWDCRWLYFSHAQSDFQAPETPSSHPQTRDESGQCKEALGRNLPSPFHNEAYSLEPLGCQRERLWKQWFPGLWSLQTNNMF